MFAATRLYVLPAASALPPGKVNAEYEGPGNDGELFGVGNGEGTTAGTSVVCAPAAATSWTLRPSPGADAALAPMTKVVVDTGTALAPFAG